MYDIKTLAGAFNFSRLVLNEHFTTKNQTDKYVVCSILLNICLDIC